MGIFNFNGSDLDDGTVVEYMFAKFADKPALFLRTDFRNIGSGCQGINLMLKFYPRTVMLDVDALKIYHDNNFNISATINYIATLIVNRLDIVIQSKPLLKNPQKTVVNNWIQTLIKS